MIDTNRQELIGGWNQRKLEKCRFLICGIGALGNEVAKNLALLNARLLTLVDYDVVEQSNLNRCVLFRNGDVGKKKVDVARRRLLEINGRLRITTVDRQLFWYKGYEPFIPKNKKKNEEVKRFNDALDRLHKKLFSETDVVVGALDNYLTRIFVNAYCVEKRKPFIDGGLDGLDGRVQVIIPGVTPCYWCNLAENLKRSTTLREQVSCSGDTDIPVASVATTTSLIASLQVNEAVKIAMKLGRPIDNRLHYVGATGKFVVYKMEKNKNCEFCGNVKAKKMKKVGK
jgi:molybdopterin/thiamine biosynthesis adenylyltransferase